MNFIIYPAEQNDSPNEILPIYSGKGKGTTVVQKPNKADNKSTNTILAFLFSRKLNDKRTTNKENKNHNGPLPATLPCNSTHLKGDSK